jgi:hypothetical protein
MSTLAETCEEITVWIIRDFVPNHYAHRAHKAIYERLVATFAVSQPQGNDFIAGVEFARNIVHEYEALDEHTPTDEGHREFRRKYGECDIEPVLDRYLGKLRAEAGRPR